MGVGYGAMPVHDGAAGFPPAGANPPSCGPRVTCTGEVPSLPKLIRTVLDWPRVSVAETLALATVRCPACSVQSWRVTAFAVTVTAAVPVTYLSSAALNCWLPT